MGSNCNRAIVSAIGCAMGILPATVLGAADCDRGARVAADIFGVAEDISAKEQCQNLKVTKPVSATIAAANPVFGPIVVTAAYAGCLAYAEYGSYLHSMTAAWNNLAANKWATFGPRQIEFNSIQSGTVVNPSKRTFVSAIPLDSDSLSVKLTKKGGGASTEVVVCSHSPSGGTRLEHNTVISGGAADGFSWSPQIIDGVLDHVVSIQVSPSGAGKQLGYTLQVNKGPVVQPVSEPETVTATATPEDVPIQTSGGTAAGLPGPSIEGPAIQTLPDGSLPQGSIADGAIPQGSAVPAPAPTADSGPDISVADAPAISGSTATTSGSTPKDPAVGAPTPVADTGPDISPAGVPSLPGAGAMSAGGSTPPLPSGNPLDSSTAPFPGAPDMNSPQCMVSSTMRFPEIRLRCGMTVRDETVRVREDFMGDCPLIAGDMVNVEVVEGGRELQITGRASGGEWCGMTYPPGYYTGPCESTESETSTTQVKTLFFQGRRIVGRVLPGGCNETKLGPGIYRVVTEIRDGAPGQPTQYSLREAGLKLGGDAVIGDVTTLLSPPVVQR